MDGVSVVPHRDWLGFEKKKLTAVSTDLFVSMREQNLTSTPDAQLIEVCREENRCLVTRDRGFGNRLRYNPSDYCKIVVLRLSPHAKFDELREAIDTLIMGLERSDVTGKLWIVKDNVIQEYQPI